MRLSFVTALVDAGADVNAEDAERGETALHGAVRVADLRLAQYLVEKGADLNIANYAISQYTGDNGWMKKASAEDVELAAARQAVAAAAGGGSGGDGDAEVEVALVPLSSVDDTPLLLALKEGADELVDFFLSIAVEKGIDIDSIDASGATALHIALEEGENDIAKTLLALGADATQTCSDFGGMPPLHYFCSLGRVRTVKLLLREGGACAVCVWCDCPFALRPLTTHSSLSLALLFLSLSLPVFHQALAWWRRLQHPRSGTASRRSSSPRAPARRR